MLLDALKELGLLLGHLSLPLAVEGVEDLVANAGADEPAQAGKGERHDAERHEGVEGDLGDDGLGHARREDDGAGAAAEHAVGDGEEELEPAALEAELEEAVPVEGVMGVLRKVVGVVQPRRGLEGLLRGRTQVGLTRAGAGKRHGDRDDGGEALLSERGAAGEARDGSGGGGGKGREGNFRRGATDDAGDGSAQDERLERGGGHVGGRQLGKDKSINRERHSQE